MEDDSTNERSSSMKPSSWALGDVMMSDSASHFGAGQDVDVDNFMHSLGEHSDSILNEETVNKITEILTPEQRMLLEEEVAGSLIKNVPDTPGLNLPTARPCCQSTGHAQTCSTAEVRPAHGRQGDSRNSEFLTSASPENRQIMQHEDGSTNSQPFKSSGAIQEGLQKIKEQLSRGGKLVTPEADPGPAVVTEFIGDHGGIGFGADLDDISKYSMDCQEQLVEKSKEIDPPVRRSGRKTVRLFEIVPPKKHRKKEGENEELSSSSQSGATGLDKDGVSKGGDRKRSGAHKGDTSPPRKSLRKPKEDSSDGKADDKQEKLTGSKQTPGSEAKKSGTGKRARGKSGQDDKEVKKPDERKSSEKTKKSAKSDSDKDTNKRKSIEDKQQGRKSRGRPSKKPPGATDRKHNRTTVKRRRGRKSKEDDGRDERGSDEESSEMSDSEPDDGELSDDGSEFDPDDDPDRPWCICRKPHGNRFMICCDICEDWYHGDCVGVTQADGKELEKRAEEWMCPKCKKKLNVLAKEVKEKERQERIKMREKTEGSSDESSTVEMRKKLLKALEKELVANKVTKKFETDDVITDSEEEGEEEVEEPKVEDGTPVLDDMKEKTKKKIKKMTKEEKEAKEAKQREKELEWKRQLKEMKARAQKAQQIAKRKDSIEQQMTFEKIGPQKVTKLKAEHVAIKQESPEKKPDIVKREIKVRFADTPPERRKSDSHIKDGDRKRPLSAGRRLSGDDLKGKIREKPEEPGKKVRTTPTPKTTKPAAPPKFCIVCSKVAMKNAVYCSKECMASYTKESLRLIAEDKLKRLGPKSPDVKSPISKDASKGLTAGLAVATSDDGDMNERIAVVERSTKKVIAGVMAPTRANIYQWVEEHPTFEVFRPPSQKDGLKTSSFYGNRATEKIQIPPATTSNTSAKEKKDLTEVVRNNVKKSLKETILSRCRDIEMEVDADEVAKICNTIEEEIVKMYGDTGQKYKTKYRSLIFNLKDSKNRSLFKQVVHGDLTPTKLVHMTPEQLASAELAKWREREAKHNLELIKMREEEEAYAFKHALKKTHKGEVEVEQDGKEDMKNLQIHIENPEEHKDQQAEEGATPVPFEDTTEQHTSHLFDLNCKICTGKQQPAGEKQPILPHVSTSVIQTIPESSMPSPTGSPEEMDLKQDSPDVIESMDRSPIHIPLPSKERHDPVWIGTVAMQSVAKFAANAYRISGPCDHLSRLVPDTAQICGRITHEQVWDYLYQLKSTSHKTIEVLRFEMAAEDEKKGYVALYTYFYTRKRIGVIGNCYSGVKDMYIVPIASHDPIPPELKPFDGPGMPDPRPHMLIGIIVRTKPVLPSKRPKTSHHESNEHSHKSKKKHKHKKDEKKKYEDIVFGKRTGIALEDTPSESGSYTPSYTPDVMSPPSHVPVPTAAAPKNDENQLLEEKLAEQKKELLKLQAEIRAQISENKALGIQSPTQTFMETSTIGVPSSTQLPDSHASLSPTVFSAASIPAASIVSSTYSTSAGGYLAPTPSVASSSAGVLSPSLGQSGVDRSKLTTGYTPSVQATSIGEPVHGKFTVGSPVRQYNIGPKGDASTISSILQASSPSSVAPVTSMHANPHSQPAMSQHPSDGDVTIPGLGDIDMSSTASPAVVSEDKKRAAEEDEPYDPEDELDIPMESDTKDEGKEFLKKDGIHKEKTEVAGGDEPYDPEDDFVLDLIEDISVPTPLKKIDKPNLPFPLEMPKKQENKMPELPPIKLPDKVTDRRAAGMMTGSTPIDPRSSPMSHGTWALTPTGTPSTQTPSPKSLTSPSSSNSQLTSPTMQKPADTRQTAQPSLERVDSSYRQSTGNGNSSSKAEAVVHDQTQPAQDYWQSNRGPDQTYAAYNQYQTSSGQPPRGSYHNTYDDNSYHREWQGGQQRAPDSSWQGYDYNNRTWEGGERGYNASWRGDYYGQEPYDDYDNSSSYHRTHEYSNFENYRRDDRGRHWDGYGDRGYYRNRDRGRSNKWR